MIAVREQINTEEKNSSTQHKLDNEKLLEKFHKADSDNNLTINKADFDGIKNINKILGLSDEPIEKRTLKELVLMHQKATLEAIGKDNWIMSRPPMHERSAK